MTHKYINTHTHSNARICSANENTIAPCECRAREIMRTANGIQRIATATTEHRHQHRATDVTVGLLHPSIRAACTGSDYRQLKSGFTHSAQRRIH